MTARDRTGEPIQPALDDPEPPAADPDTGEILTQPGDPASAAGWLEHMRQTLRAGR